MIEKLKSLVLDDAFFYAGLVISVALVAFLLGRNSMIQIEPQAAGVQITQQTASVVEQKSDTLTNDATSVVVSRSGTKYHLPTCPGAKQIKDSNIITFSTIEQAKAAGYSAAANCKGLE
jgi:hypothetical protein